MPSIPDKSQQARLRLSTGSVRVDRRFRGRMLREKIPLHEHSEDDQFEKAIAAFAVAYADQAERDFECLKSAVRAGQIEAIIEDDDS